MYLYKNTSRYNLLLWVDGQIIEVYPNVTFTSNQIINHPCIGEVVEEKKNARRSTEK